VLLDLQGSLETPLDHSSNPRLSFSPIMSEKKIEEPTVAGGEKDVDYAIGDVHPTSRRKSSAVNPEILAGEIFDERYETTKRGLKSRYLLFTHTPQLYLISCIDMPK
jgi:hypothetical protein